MTLESLTNRVTLVALTVLAISAHPVRAEVPASPPRPAPGSVVALVGATVYPITSAPIERGIVLVRDGVIAEVGRDVAIPPEATRVDLTGASLYPGFVSAHTILGLTEIGSVRQMSDYEETGRINPNARAESAFNPDSELLPVARANGVTTALVVPRGGLLSGTSAMMRMDGWTIEDMTVASPVALHLQWPGLSLNRAPDAKPGVDEQIKNRDRALLELQQLFDDARAWLTAREAQGLPQVARAEQDVRWAAMTPFLKGEAPVVVHAGAYAQIESALDWARTERVKLVLAGAQDAPLLAERLKEQDVAVITQGILARPPRDYEPYDQIYTLPARLAAAGVHFCISTGGDASNERNLPYHAAMAWSYGLSHDEALKAVTIYPAEILGLGDRLGSIEAGKEANLIVTTGDPLDIRTQVTREWIRGREVSLESRHTTLWKKYRDRPRTGER